MHPVAEPVARSSADPNAERISELKRLFPEAFADGKVDCDRLRAALGEAVAEPGRFLFTWAGRADALDVLRTPSRATLVPCPDESVSWDRTRQLFVEGGQPGGAEAPVQGVRGEGEADLHRPAIQHGPGLRLPGRLRRPPGPLPPAHGPAGRGGEPADQQPGDERPLPLGLAVDDVPAAVPGPAAPARRRGDLRQHRRPRGAPPADADERGVWGGELCGQRDLGKSRFAAQLGASVLGRPRLPAYLLAAPRLGARSIAPDRRSELYLHEPRQRSQWSVAARGPLREPLLLEGAVHHHRAYGQRVLAASRPILESVGGETARTRSSTPNLVGAYEGRETEHQAL